MNGQVADALRQFFEAHPYGALAAYLFGSAARGALRGDSDIDVGVLLAEPPASTLDGQPYDLEGALERALGRPVDLVVLNSALVDLRLRVLQTGRLVVDRDRSARIQFEVRTRNEAFDLEPILRRYRRTTEHVR